MAADHSTTECRNLTEPGLSHLMVSSNGDVWSSKVGRWHNSGPWKKLSGQVGKRGYRTIIVGRSRVYVHHLVLLAFVGPRPAGMECRHLNGIRADNRLENLAWGTKAENGEDRRRHGTSRLGNPGMPGESNPAAKLTTEDIDAIRKMLAEKVRPRVIADMFCVTQATVYRINSGETWTHLPPAKKQFFGLTTSQVEEIRRLLATRRFSCKEIASRVGSSSSTVCRINTGKYLGTKLPPPEE